MSVKDRVGSGTTLQTLFLLGSTAFNPLAALSGRSYLCQRGSERLRHLPEVMQQGSSRDRVESPGGLTLTRGKGLLGLVVDARVGDVEKDSRPRRPVMTDGGSRRRSDQMSFKSLSKSETQEPLKWARTQIFPLPPPPFCFPQKPASHLRSGSGPAVPNPTPDPPIGAFHPWAASS